MEDGVSLKKAECRNLVFDMGLKCTVHTEQNFCQF